MSPTTRPLSVIANLSILLFSDQHVSKLYIYYFYCFQFAPARFPRAGLLFSHRLQERTEVFCVFFVVFF